MGGRKTAEGIALDRHFGEQLKLSRLARLMTRESLAEKIGITPQQISKYEDGTNAISLSMAYRICKAIEMPFDAWVEGLRRAVDVGEAEVNDVVLDRFGGVRCGVLGRLRLEDEGAR